MYESISFPTSYGLNSRTCNIVQKSVKPKYILDLNTLQVDIFLRRLISHKNISINPKAMINYLIESISSLNNTREVLLGYMVLEAWNNPRTYYYYNIARNLSKPILISRGDCVKVFTFDHWLR